MRLKVEYARLGDLAPYANNSKEHPSWQVEQIANSIDQFGFCDPVGVWTNPDGVLEIVEGHGRVMACKELGWDDDAKVPIVKLDHLDDDARRAYVHVHNQTTLTSGLDSEMLEIDMEQLGGFDWEAFGFDKQPMADDFGQEFELPNGEGPEFKTVSLHMTQEQYMLFQQMQGEVSSEGDDGNAAARQVCEVIRQWQAQRI